MSRQLRLTSSSGVEYLARIVYHGDAYGDGKRVNTGYRPLVEFVMPRGIRSLVPPVYPSEDLPLRPGWEPGGVPQLALPKQEMERLRVWLDDPSTVEDEAVVLVVGDDEELDKVGVALRRLRLDPRREADALRALARVRAVTPTLVVVGQEVGRLGTREFVHKIVAAEATREVPVVVVGGSAEAAAAAGAALHVPLPPDYGAFVKDASELLDLV